MKLDGYTRLAAVVANPIKHSISPFIHNTAFEATAPMVFMLPGKLRLVIWNKQSEIFVATRCLESISLCPTRNKSFPIWMN